MKQKDHDKGVVGQDKPTDTNVDLSTVEDHSIWKIVQQIQTVHSESNSNQDNCQKYSKDSQYQSPLPVIINSNSQLCTYSSINLGKLIQDFSHLPLSTSSSYQGNEHRDVAGLQHQVSPDVQQFRSGD